MFCDCNRETPDTRSSGSCFMRHLGLNWIHSDQPNPFILPTQTRDTKAIWMAYSISGRTQILEPRSLACPFLRVDSSYKQSHGRRWRGWGQREDSCLNTTPGEFLGKCQEWDILWAISSGWALSFQSKAEAPGPQGWTVVKGGRSLC